ncbi:MAG: BlaI/MecI/CopY family transcriptional regulator [Thermoanaerobaculia bacterium]
MLPFGLSPRGASTLGPLEAQVMEIIWRRGEPSNVRDVREALGGPPAYTTVMTTLDRLFKKELLVRHREGRGFVYSARVSREELSRQSASAVVVALLGSDPAARPILSAIVDAVSESDRAMLDELERLVRSKRRELEGGP